MIAEVEVIEGEGGEVGVGAGVEIEEVEVGTEGVKDEIEGVEVGMNKVETDGIKLGIGVEAGIKGVEVVVMVIETEMEEIVEAEVEISVAEIMTETYLTAMPKTAG